MNKSLFILLLCLLSAAMSAQQMTITDFELNLRDQTANNEETKVIDDNGNPCALLKIETLQKGFTIDGGSVGIARVEENHAGEIWVYVPAKLRRITIAHNQLGILRDYVFPEALQPARTYIMKLVSGTVQTAFAMKKVASDVETITVNGVTFRMHRVEGGTFQMGSESRYTYDDKPVHSVTLSDYYIGETEVTQALWTAVMGSNPSNWKGDNLPVEKVSWDDCQEFINKLNQLTGKRFALPTEAQWEYAARGGSKSRGYEYSGSNNIDDVAWYWYKGKGYGSRKTHQVGTKQANELGLYDMSGNVYEWCQDYWYGSYSSSSQTDPAGPSTGSNRVIRGGSWYGDAGICRSAYRGNRDPGYSCFNLGFRLVLLL